MSIKDSENGIYQWVYEMATSIEDVTAEHRDDLTKYSVALREGDTADTAEKGYVYEIKLNPNAKWENGEAITADDYIYSMQQLLNPKMKNYRANLYYAGESAVAGGNAYYNAGSPIYDVMVPAYGDGETPDYSYDLDKGIADGMVYVNVSSDGMTLYSMSLAIDRAEYVTATQGYKPAYSLMNNLYHYDIFNDPTSSYRGSDEAMQAICNLYGVKYGEGTPYATLKDAYQSITGYNLTEAKELFAAACKELVEAGLYKEGEPIVIRIGWAKGALQSADNKQCEILTKQLNAALEGSGFGTLTLEAVGNINNRYADVANGEYAIGYGAWGGAALYPFRNFQVSCDTDQYDVNEIGCWDPATEMLTLNVNGEDVTMSWKDWSGALIGTGRFTDADFATKLYITAQMEELYLQKYYRIPLAGKTSVSLLSYQVDYYTEDYNLMYGFGGLRLMTFNYTDAEWAEYVAEEGGTLSYE